MRGTIWVIALQILLAITSQAAPLFNITDFTGSSIQRVGNASTSGTKVRLTSSTTSQTSAAWFKTPQDVTQSFTTTVSFTISAISNNPSWPNGADGLALVIQNDPRTPLSTVLGGTSDQLGYGGNGIGPGVAIQRSLAVTLRTVIYQEIQVFTNGDNPDSRMSTDTPNYQLNTPPLARQNGKLPTIVNIPQTLTLNYDASAQAVTVLLDGQSIGINAVPLGQSLSSLVEGNTAIFGVTGATGGGYATTDITSFTAATVPEPFIPVLGGAIVFLFTRQRSRAAYTPTSPSPRRLASLAR